MSDILPSNKGTISQKSNAQLSFPSIVHSEHHSFEHRSPVLSSILPTSPPLTLIGRSRAAYCTAFYIPELRIALDAGESATSTIPKAVFVTHSHADHIYNLHNYVSRRIPPKLFVPLEMVPLVEKFIRTAEELNHGGLMTDEQYGIPNITIGVKAGDIIELNDGKHEVHVVQCCHSISCTGYLFYEVRWRLKDEYRGMSGKDLGALRKANPDLQTSSKYLKPLIAFLGDTTPDVFNMHPEILDMPTVIVECSFLDPEHKVRADKTLHTHWHGLSPIVKSAKNTLFVLIHFSCRYDRAKIHQFFKEHIDECGESKVMVWA